MHVRRIFWGPALGVIAILLLGCPDAPPPGPDLVDVNCLCKDTCNGTALIPVQGAVCTDATVPQNLQDSIKFLCKRKETVGFNVCKITDCSPQFHNVTTHGCPADNGDFVTGDIGQSLAKAVPPSKVVVSGEDINRFTITPQSFVVHTTQEGSTLNFTFLQGSLGTTTFTSDGIFGDDEHTLADGKLYGAPFSVTLQPDGKYTIPPNANFITTGKLDGDRVSLTLANPNLGGVYDEAAGQFTLAGTVKAVGADISMNVDLVFQFTNRPPRAVAGPDQTVECSAGNQTGTVSLSGAASTDPDGSADIARFTWYVDGTEAATGRDVQLPIGLGTHEVKLIVADQQGRFGGDALTVTVADTKAPVIQIVEPKPISYTHSETIVLDYTVTDVCTGVNSFTPLMDGAATVGGHGLQSGQAIHLLTELALGDHTFSITAVDKQGNDSSASVTFSIVVTPESIQEAVKQFVASGAITLQSQALLGRLQNAARLYHDKKCGPAGNIYQSFIQTVQAQRGKGIDPAAADILIADAQFLIDHCP